MSSPLVPAAALAVARVTTLLQAKSYAEARSEAERGLKHWPQSAELWNLLGAALIMTGSLLPGYRAACRAQEIDPSVLGASENAATALDGLRQPYRSALIGLAGQQDEAAWLETAFDEISKADDQGLVEQAAGGVCLGLFLRLAAVEQADRRWPFPAIGRDLARQGEHRFLFYQLPRVRDDADRRELLEQHRLWGEAVERLAAAQPIRPSPRGPRTRPRVGLMSSDLRMHVVAPFVAPLLDDPQSSGVEIYCYSAHPGEADGFQRYAAGQATGFRHLPGADAAEMARAIGADAPDVLIEIGGSTTNNRLEALAHRLAPAQMSWLGYPHSAGLSTIDYMVLDPHMAPTDPGLILERPLLMPHTWVAMSPGYFRDDIPLSPGPPQDRKGFVTFGTAGNPYKYSAAALEAWGRVMQAVPGSHFLFVRPEGGSPSFRRHIEQSFARFGVAPERLEFAAVRGAHLPHYAEIDIALDTFPLTGGMTTCEALWMGVPVVTLAGKAVYERLSHSLLINAGLADLSADTIEGFVARAADLARDRDRLAHWRAHGRRAIRDGPLGDLPGFARDFFRLVTSVF